MAFHRVMASALNLRLAPDKDSGSLGTIPRQTRVEEIGANADRTWLEVRAGGRRGWVSNVYLLPEDLVAFSWVARAAAEFGVGEYDDSEDPPSNPRVQEYQASFGGDAADQDEEVAWCSSFANWCLNPEFDTEGRSRLARSWRAWAEDAGGPRPGAIVVFWRRPGPEETDDGQHDWDKQRLIAHGSKGHVAFLIEVRGGQAIVLGGNQSSRANRLGEVNKTAYPLDGDDYGVLTYRWPT